MTRYPRKDFQQADSKVCYELIHKYPLAGLLLLIGANKFPHISHLPFYLEASTNKLIGHVSNNHPLAQKLMNNLVTKIQLIFNGVNGYISPNYAKEQVVPTWNYAAVTVQATANIVNDKHDKLRIMKMTTAHFEHSQTIPWKLSAMTEKKLTMMLNAITVFTLTITEINGNFKLSQNKSSITQQEISRYMSNF
ncbi:MAG: FMN-binding negative transcriptional regulator [Aliivibrio sp.]|uniref:FMN-binding negative transcriptional regulator n=1 Tax=Aliivibrio sp. TaxID=1872443 RepID=UPI001A3675A4|nr:FMN-binding negative transcriptional regulator [Aliivibrio sp.]